MAAQPSSDFRIKLLVVHPDGRRQKFLVTFPERRSLKIDQRYLNIPITLRVEFLPGSIVCKPGTGHTLTVGGKPANEHTLNLNDTVGLDQFSIEFLELPEPLPMEEATRMVNINEVSEATVVVPLSEAMNESIVAASPAASTTSSLPPAAATSPQPVVSHEHAPPVDTKVKDLFSKTPARTQEAYNPQQIDNKTPQAQSIANRTPTPVVPQSPASSSRTPHEVENSTAIIRRLQVPGAPPGGNPYASLNPAFPSRPQGSSSFDVPERNDQSITRTGTGTGIDFGPTLKRKYAMAAASFFAILILIVLFKKGGNDLNSKDAMGMRDPSSESIQPAVRPEDLEMKPMQVEVPVDAPPSQTSAQVPAPKAENPIAASADLNKPAPPTDIGGAKRPIESPFDDTSGFDIMAVDAFFDAIDSGNQAKIKSLLDKHVVDVNLSRRKGYAALHVAAARGDLEVVKLLLKNKADPNVVDPAGATPLMWSVFKNRKAVAEFLSTKTDLKLERQGGETAYDMAKRLDLKSYYSFLNPAPHKAAKKRVPSSLPKKRK